MNAPVQLRLPNLDIDVLRSFVAIADSGSFTRAAEAVLRTPSAVSMQIKKLEETIGRAVFDRSNRAVALTPDGELLLGYARRILDLDREAVARFCAPDVEGVVRIGATEEFAEHTLPDILRRFAELYPRVSVDVMIPGRDIMLDCLAAGRLDLALFNAIEGDELGSDIRTVMEVPLVWAGLAGGTAHSRSPLPVAMWNEECAWHRLAVKSLAAAGRDYRVSFMSGSTSGQRAAILADLAVAPYPESLIRVPLVRLGRPEGLAEIGTYRTVMKVAENAGAAARTLADDIIMCCR